MGFSLKVMGALTLLVSVLFTPCVVNADNNDDAKNDGVVVVLRKKIVDYNNVEPLQNPRYERSDKIVKRKITDNKNKVIGEVKDILFGLDGQVKSLYVDFDRLNLRKSVYLSHKNLDIKSTSSGYRLGFDSDEVETLYPALLSGIEAAAGEASDSTYKNYSLNDILGSKVVDSDGLIIGELEDIFFDREGKYIRSAYLKINFQTIRNKGVAVPLSVLDFEERADRHLIVVHKSYVEPILDMARED